MASTSNPQVAPSPGLTPSHQPTPELLPPTSHPPSNEAARNLSPSSVSSAGESSGRKMKRTGAKRFLRPSPYSQAPPWATSLLGGRSSIGSAAPSLAQQQSNSATEPDIVDHASALDSQSSNLGSPEPAHIVSDIVKPEAGSHSVINLEEATPLDPITEFDMAGSRKSLAASAKIQALQQSWALSNESTPGERESTDNLIKRAESADRGRDWLRGGLTHDASAPGVSRKRSLPGSLTGSDTKRRLIDIGQASFERQSGTATPTTELDLLNAVSAGRPQPSKPSVPASTAGLNGTADGDKPGFIPVARNAQAADSSDEDTGDDNTDDEDTGDESADGESPANVDGTASRGDETANERESNVSIAGLSSGPNLFSAFMMPSDTGRNLRQQNARMPKMDSELQSKPEENVGLVHTKGNDRAYLTWKTPAGFESSCGAILPTKYQLHSNLDNPFICPVRNCRTIFSKMNALGAHFCAKHRNSKFNDNLDGTLSFVDYYKKPTAKYAAPIVVSQNPLRGDEPPMAEPAMPGNKAAAQAPSQTTPLSGSKSRIVTLIVPNSTSSPSAATKATAATPPEHHTTRSSLDGVELYRYLSTHLSPAYKVPTERPDVKALLKLPRRRALPQPWKQKYTGVGHLAALATVSLLVYLTGDPAPNRCTECHGDPTPSEDFLQPCVVMSAAAPAFLKEIGNKACAACQWRSNFRREKNSCSFLHPFQVSSSLPAASTASPVTTPSAADSFELPYPQRPQPSQQSQSSPLLLSNLPTQDNHVATPASTAPARRVTRHSLAASKVVAEPNASSTSPASAASSLTGNLLPSKVLEMEDWEVAPGRIRDEGNETSTNVAFSNSYLTTNQAVSVSEDISFNVVVIKPGNSHKWTAEPEKVRICSLATGKLKVKMENTDPFQIGPNGMFKLKPGVACTVENRLYIDVVVHVTSVAQS